MQAAGKAQGGSLDNEHANKTTLILTGVLLLFLFMDSQARRHRADTPAPPEEGVAGAPGVPETIRSSAANILETPAVENGTPALETPRRSPHTDAVFPARGGLDLYFIRFRGSGSEIIRVRRNYQESNIRAVALLELLRRGPLPAERGLLNAFDRVDVRSAWMDGSTLVVDLSPAIGAMSEHVIRDRLDQLVLTLTSLEGVRSVRIMVEGESARTLASGKIDISAPLTRPVRRVTDFTPRRP